MDFSKEYIKMCKKAKKIQKGHNADYGDCYYDCEDSYTGFVGDTKLFTSTDSVWLPRQDQLQEMVIGSDDTITLTEYFLNTVSLYFNRKLSMEQLWLMYVMKKKYSKQWDSKKWKK